MAATLTATDRVFGIGELYETVIDAFANLEYEDIFRATLVSRQWRHTILDSAPIRQKLFLVDGPHFQDTKAVAARYRVGIAKNENPDHVIGVPAAFWSQPTVLPDDLQISRRLNTNPLLLRLLRDSQRHGIESPEVRRFFTLGKAWMSGFVFTPTTEVVTLTLTHKVLRAKNQGSANSDKQLHLCTSDYDSGLRMSDVFAEIQKLNHRSEELGYRETYHPVLAMENTFSVRPGRYVSPEASSGGWVQTMGAWNGPMSQVYSSMNWVNVQQF